MISSEVMQMINIGIRYDNSYSQLLFSQIAKQTKKRGETDGYN